MTMSHDDDATMTHNEGWHFSRLGRQLERADHRIQQCRGEQPTESHTDESRDGMVDRNGIERKYELFDEGPMLQNAVRRHATAQIGGSAYVLPDLIHHSE